MATKLDDRQVVNRAVLPMVGNAANDTLDTIFPKIDAELSKLFEDRNFLLAGGGTITVNGTGTSVTFSAALELHVNSLVSGATPSIIDLAATTRSFSSDGRMLYAVIDRIAATATVTADSIVLPAVTSTNQEIVLIAKRIGTSIFFRNGSVFPINASATFDNGINGSVGSVDNQLVRTDGTGTHNIQGSGITVSDTNDLAGINTETVVNNIITGTERENISTDSSTTGSNATLATPTTPIVRLTNASLVSIDMLAAGASGQQQTIMNVTGTAITLNNLTGGTAANQFITGTNANLSIANGASIIVKYDDTSAKWRVIGGSGSGSGSGGINFILTPDAESGSVGWSTYSDTQTFTVTIASPAVFTVGSTTGFYVGQPHVFTTTGALPTGLVVGTTYYISSGFSGTTFNVSATPGGVNVNTSGTQSGTHTDRPLVPLDGTGGSPTVTWTTSTSSPLRGLTSFVLTKSAADLAGEGTKYDFTIDEADKGKVLQGYVDYAISSGTYVDNDVTFWIVDVTNGTVIQPAPYLLKNTALSSDRMPFEFQTSSNSTSYRLVIHIASASTSAYTIKFDNFNVGPQAKLYGSTTTDWIAYTPTFTGFGTVTGIEFFWKRNGDSIQITGNAIAGTPTGVEARISLPSGYTSADISTIPTRRNLNFFPRGTSTNNVLSSMIEPNVTYMTFGTIASANPLNKGNGTDIIAASNAFSIGNVTIPIKGWSSSQVMSSDANTRVVAFLGAKGSNQAVTSLVTNITYTAAIDTHGAWSTDTWTCPVPGEYSFSTRVNSAAGSSIYVYVNGVQTAYLSNSNLAQILSGTTIVKLKAGDLITFRSSTATTINGDSTTALSAYVVSIQKISGPSQIAASESVSASYWLSANFAASTTTPINFDTKEWDSHNAVTTSPTAWKFTAPMSGIFSIAAFINNTAPAATAEIRIYKNGISYKTASYVVSGTVTQGYTNIKLLAGEYIDIRPSVSATYAGGTLVGAVASHIDITRVGNY